MKFKSLTVIFFMLSTCLYAGVHINAKLCANNSDTAYFTLSNTTGVDSATWIFKDSLGQNDTLDLINAWHIFTDNGNYQVDVTYFINGAPHTIDTVFAIIAPPREDLTLEVNICYGQKDTLYAGPPTNKYQWEDGSTSNTFILKDDTSAFAQYYVTESNECGSIFEYCNVYHHHIPTVNFGPPDTTICNLQPILLTIKFKDAFIHWSNGSADTFMVAGHTAEYSVTLTNVCGSASDSIDVIFQLPPHVHLGDDTTICQGHYVAWNVSTLGATYLWNDGSKSPLDTVRQTEKVYVTVKDNCGTSSDTVNVRVEKVFLHLPSDTLICSGTEFIPNIYIDSTTHYSWSTGSTSPTDTISVPGTYYASVKNQCGAITDSFQVNFNLLYLNLPPDTAVCFGTQFSLNIFIDSSTNYLWSTGSNNPSITIDAPGTYSATVTNQCGSQSGTFLVTYHDCSSCALLPDAFSPNGDGRNDLFRVISNCTLLNFNLKIFNRWGEMVFETTNPASGWDGKYNGKEQPIGSYAYVLKYGLPNGNGVTSDSKQGNVTLIR